MTSPLDSVKVEGIQRHLQAGTSRARIRDLLGVSAASISRVANGIHAPGARRPVKSRCSTCGGKQRPITLEPGRTVHCLVCEVARAPIPTSR